MNYFVRLMFQILDDVVIFEECICIVDAKNNYDAYLQGLQIGFALETKTKKPNGTYLKKHFLNVIEIKIHNKKLPKLITYKSILPSNPQHYLHCLQSRAHKLELQFS